MKLNTVSAPAKNDPAQLWYVRVTDHNLPPYITAVVFLIRSSCDATLSAFEIRERDLEPKLGVATPSAYATLAAKYILKKEWF